MAFCHYCDMTALGCSGCDAQYAGLTTHGHHPFLGFGYPLLSSKTVMSEMTLHLSAALLSDNNPHKSRIDESLKTGTLSRFGRCLLSAAIQNYAVRVAEQLGPKILPELEQILVEDEETKARARKAAEEAAIERARAIAQKAAEETAKKVADHVAREVAPPAAREAAVEPAKLSAIEVAKREAPPAAREAAMQPATETATTVATQIANEVSPREARDAAVPPATAKAAEIAQELVSRKLQELDIIKQEMDTKKELDNFVNNHVSIKGVPPSEVRRRIEIAAKNAPLVTKAFKIPPAQATQVPRLALYDFLILCDDSGSMKNTSDRRIATQEATVRGLFNILKALGSERLFAVMPFEFEDKYYKDLKTPHAVEGALSAISYDTGLNALKPLQRLIRGRLEKQAKDQSLPPTVVVVITDGDTGPVTDFAEAIAKFKSVLRHNGYTGPSAFFLVCRVGSDQRAEEELKNLNRDKNIKNMLLYSEDQLDAKLAKAGGNLNEYTGWVVGELLKAMELQITQS